MTHPFLYDLCFAFYLPKCKHMSNVQTCGGEQSPSIPYLWLSSAAPISSGEQVCPSLIVQAMWGGRADGKTQRKAPTSDPWPRSSQLWGLWMVSFVLLIWNNLRLLFGAGPWVYVSRWGAATKMLCICLQKLRQRPGCKLSTTQQIEFDAVAVILIIWMVDEFGCCCCFSVW